VSPGSHTTEAHSIEIALIGRAVIDPAETADEGSADEIPRGHSRVCSPMVEPVPVSHNSLSLACFRGGNPTIGILEWWYDTYAQAILCSSICDAACSPCVPVLEVCLIVAGAEGIASYPSLTLTFPPNLSTMGWAGGNLHLGRVTGGEPACYIPFHKFCATSLSIPFHNYPPRSSTTD
jgi:hypothetical protein